MSKTLKIVGGVVVLLLIVAGVGWAMMRKPDIPYPTLEQKYANAQSRYVELPGGVRAHYRDQGNPKGPVLVLVHGFYVSLETWEPWVKRLGKDYRIVTVDLPGHGLTRAPKGYAYSLNANVGFLDAFARKQGLEHFVLGGSSMGGDVAWRYALAHPERLKGLILVDAAGWPDTRPGHDKAPAGLETMRNPVMRLLLRDLDSSKQAGAGLRAAYFDPKFAPDALVTRDIELSRAPGHRDAILDLALGYGKDYATPARLAAIKLPTLILAGEKDQLVPPANASRFATAIPGSRLILYPNTGHVPQEEAADRSAADVAAFLAGLNPKKPAAPKPAASAAAVSRNPNAVVFY
jgi:pimeloyl-ACP methyl ester carboxylesterase